MEIFNDDCFKIKLIFLNKNDILKTKIHQISVFLFLRMISYPYRNKKNQIFAENDESLGRIQLVRLRTERFL